MSQIKLSIGLPSYNNFTEVWFTIQNLRLNHDLTDCEILVVDNFGDKKLEDFIKNWCSNNTRYEKFTDVTGTSEVRNKIFDFARGEMVMVLDSHVILKPGALKNIPVTDDLIHGPLVYDNCTGYVCDWRNEWRAQMWGIWGDYKTELPRQPFEIWGCGLGLFLTRRSTWLRFNADFRGFGGEEGYIHEKYRKAGRKVLCDPNLIWMHLFTKPIPYPLKLVDRIRNYLIGFTELGLNTQPIIDHFTKERADGAKLVAEAQSLIGVKSIITTPAQPKPERKIITDKISCVMTTFRRFSCVERSISMFLNQDYKGESELIVFNTDTEHLMELSEELKNKNVQVINCGIDSITKQPYTNVGAIRRDALEYASGEFYICWDDDDIFLPWNNRQCFEGLKRNNIKAFKPRQSFFARQNGIIELAQNTLEASVIVNIREVVFDLKTGAEHLQWYIKLRDEKQLNENSFDSVPAYCFNWGDPSELAGHKQSGSINDPNNFENHKVHTKDFAKRPLQRIDLTKTYAPYFKFFKEHVTEFNTVYYEKYVKPYLSEVV